MGYEFINIPKHWSIKKMPDVVKWGSGGTPKATEKAYYENGTIPWLIIGDLNDGIVTESATKITELGLENSSAKMIPIGTLLASTFDEELVERVYTAVSGEMADKGSDVLLAPGINIHRSPLCGRNFEYYSEDPLLCGKIAASAVRGIQHNNRSACPKHFACNSQEYNRAGNDSRLSERALREIYLRGFEICVKEGKPNNIMTSYNLINGVWGHYNYELCTRVLREEWGYEGNVMTDWWMKKSKSQEFPEMCDQAYRVLAQVDLLMPGGGRVCIIKKPDGTLLKTLGKNEGITYGEMQRSAMNILKFAMNSSAMERI